MTHRGDFSVADHSAATSRYTKSAGSNVGSSSAMSFRPQTGSYILDKSAILWKDMMNGVARRKGLLRKLKEAASETATAQGSLKRMLYEIRQTTLSIIEDALEIEYRFQVFDPSTMNAKKLSAGAGKKRAMQLPPISSFRAMEDKEDIYALADMISDVDELLHIPNISVMLPKDFPDRRNPFMLGKDVDELATLNTPHPEPGNAEEELKVLELLRYKRAARALLRAESQVLNKLPLSLYDVDRLLQRMDDDANIERLIRAVYALLDNDRMDYGREAELQCLMSPIFQVDGHDLISRLNRFKGVYPMRIDVQVAIRQYLSECHFDYLEDPVSVFLLDWVNLILSQSVPRSRQQQQQQQQRGSLMSSQRPRTGLSELGPIQERPASRPQRTGPFGDLQHSQSLSQFPPPAAAAAASFSASGAGAPHRRSSSPVAPLTRRNLNELSSAGGSVGDGGVGATLSAAAASAGLQYEDLTSEVSDSDRRGTHEKIFVEAAPKVKSRIGSVSSNRPGSRQLPGAALDRSSLQSGGSIFGGSESQHAGADAIAAAACAASGRRPTSNSLPMRRFELEEPSAESEKYLATTPLSPPHPQSHPQSQSLPFAHQPRDLLEVESVSLTNTRQQQTRSEQQALDQVRDRKKSKIEPRRKSHIGAQGTLKKLEESSEAQMKFRLDVERIVQEMQAGGGALAGKYRGGYRAKASADEFEEMAELDRINSLRYELHRMQEELLRRQVLDPRYYRVNSVDAVAQAQAGLTVPGINASDPEERKKQRQVAALAASMKLVSYLSRDIRREQLQDGEHRTSVEILLDLVGEQVLGRICLTVDPSIRPQQTGADFGDYALAQAATAAAGGGAAAADAMLTPARSKSKVVTQTVAETAISKLIFNRLTGALFSEIVNATREERGRVLQDIVEQLHSRALDEQPPLRGRFVIRANRVLFSNKFTEDGVLVDLVIMRNDSCDGIVIHCTPLAGIFNPGKKNNGVGPVSILLHDKELHVLLINQYGLYKQALERWSSMQLVASWLSGRLRIRKVKVEDTTLVGQADAAADVERQVASALAATGGDADSEEVHVTNVASVVSSATGDSAVNGPNAATPGINGNAVEEQESFVSAVTFDETAKVIEAAAPTKGTSHKITSVPLKASLRVVDQAPAAASAVGNQMVAVAVDASQLSTLPSTELSYSRSASAEGAVRRGRPPRMLVLLDVQLDRSIEISAALQLQWRSRNVPNIAGLLVTARAWQDMELMRVAVTLTVPLPHKHAQLARKMKQQQKREKQNASTAAAAAATEKRQRKRRGSKEDAAAALAEAELDDLEGYSDEEEDPNLGVVTPTEIVLEHRLTSAELAVFGAAELLDNKKIALSQYAQQRGGDDHPETFLWNVFSRIVVGFRGSTAAPFERAANANDASNWELQFKRTLARDVRTVSNAVLILTVSAIGGELLIDAEPIDGTVFQQVQSKLFSAAELADVVYTEGLPLKFIEHSQRVSLAAALLDKLKVVDADTQPRLELYSFPESRMLRIAHFVGPKDADVELGSVEINHASTLSDLRVLIRNEIDLEDLPHQFRFLYKGGQCAIRQEPFRRAWDCLPTCRLVPKQVETVEMATETEDILRRRAEELRAAKKAVVKVDRLPKGQRRVLGKFSPLPVPTLCQVKEGRRYIHLLHNAAELGLVPGEIIRVGGVSGRDYIITELPEHLQQRYPRTIKIEPGYDLLEEPELTAPAHGNFVFPPKGEAGKYLGPRMFRPVQLLLGKEQLGLDYTVPQEKELLAVADVNSADRSGTGSGGGSNVGAVSVAGGSRSIASASAAGTAVDASTGGGGGGSISGGESGVEDDGSVGSGTILMVSKRGRRGDKKRRGRQVKQAFEDCWLWRCVPSKEDDRPKWQQLYDEGRVPYRYEFIESGDCEEHFRVLVRHGYLEVLCTDSRCPSLTFYAQRVEQMKSIPAEFYAKLAFDRVTDWTPVYKKGIDRTKFIKLIRDVSSFPDLRKSARVAQIDMHFLKEAKGEFGVVGKHVTYPGFCRLLQTLALIRFPDRSKASADDSLAPADATAAAADDASVTKKKLSPARSPRNSNSNSSADAVSPKNSKLTRTASTSSIQNNNNNSSIGSGVAGKANAAADASSAAAAPADDDVDPEVAAAAKEREKQHQQRAYYRFLTEFVMMYGNWYEEAWSAAKLKAMRLEAVRYCAATRVQALVRQRYWRRRYLHFLRTFVVLQAAVRRFLAVRRVQKYVAMLREDWCLRVRYHCAVLIQTLIRKFVKRCWFYAAMEKIKAKEVLVQKARRARMKKVREQAKKAILYKEVKRVNGIMVYIRLLRKDTRNYTRDVGLTIEVYVPQSQNTFRFPLEDAELRMYMALELGVDAVGVGDCIDRRNLQRLVSSRMIIHKPASKYGSIQVLFSKHALGQRGEKTLTRGKRIAGEFFVCKIFETGDDVAVQCYHRHTCKIFNCHMTMPEMRAWIMEEHKLHAKDELEGHRLPPELRPENKKLFYKFVLEHLAVDKRKGQFRVVFASQLMKSRKSEMVVKIQAAWRRALTRPLIIAKLNAFMLKVKVDTWDDTIYYLNRKTGASSWEKPRLLGYADLPTEPTRRWVPLQYENESGDIKTHYVNPFTGKYTHLLPGEAAHTIQKLIRNFLLRPISMPHEHFVRAGKIYKTARHNYDHNPRKLSAVINYAICTHVVDMDETLAKELYAQAVELSESNPLVTRAYAFFMIGTCEAPVALNRERASILLGDARRKDEDHQKFQIAYFIFQFAVLRRPTDYHALLNLALVQILLYDMKTNAEKLLRRALAIAPFEERVMSIWKFLRHNFPERQLLYSSQSRVNKVDLKKGGKKRIIHGRPATEDSNWAGWVYIEHDEFQVSKLHRDESYWYNPADGTESLYPPDFKEQWLVRRSRSHFQEEAHGLEHYYDPLTAEYFQYHPLTDTYQ